MFKHLNTRIPKRIEQEKDKVSAVMIPLIKKNDGYHILFEVRSNKLSQQPGEICFPGGRREHDETSMETSIRETCEELLISESNIKLYGPLDYFLSPAGLRIDPYLGELVNYDGQYSNDEVSEIFTVPLAFFQNTPPKCYYNKVTMYPTDNFPFDKVPGGKEYPWARGEYEVLFYEYDPVIQICFESVLLDHYFFFYKFVSQNSCNCLYASSSSGPLIKNTTSAS